MRLSLFIGLLAAVVACRPAQKADEFVLTIALPSQVATPDGRSVNGLATVVNEWLYEPLLQVEEDGFAHPALASSAEKLPDGRLRLRLRPGATFSDGSPVTLQDARDSLGTNQLRVEVEGDALLVSSTLRGLSAEAILPTLSVSKTKDGRQLGSGPFEVVEQDAQHLLLMRRIKTAGLINTIRLTSYDGPREAMARVLRGDANMLLTIDSRDVEFFDGVSRLRVLRSIDPHVLAVAMNPTRVSKEDRIAIAQALPVTELTQTVFGNSSCRPWSQHPDQTAALPPGRPLKIIAEDLDAEVSKLALATRRTLGPRGGELQRLKGLESMQQLEAGNYDLAVISLLIWPIGMAAMNLHTGFPLNTWHYSNPEVDAALEQGDWLKTLEALDRDPPLVFVCTREHIAIVDARIKNARLGPWGLLQTLPEWEVGE